MGDVHNCFVAHADGFFGDMMKRKFWLGLLVAVAIVIAIAKPNLFYLSGKTGTAGDVCKLFVEYGMTTDEMKSAFSTCASNPEGNLGGVQLTLTLRTPSGVRYTATNYAKQNVKCNTPIREYYSIDPYKSMIYEGGGTYRFTWTVYHSGDPRFQQTKNLNIPTYCGNPQGGTPTPTPGTCPNSQCEIGKQIPGYCPDGTKVTIKECVAYKPSSCSNVGIWELTNACSSHQSTPSPSPTPTPSPNTCTEGVITSEPCLDGSVINTSICVNGVVQYTDQKCPTIPTVTPQANTSCTSGNSTLVQCGDNSYAVGSRCVNGTWQVIQHPCEKQGGLDLKSLQLNSQTMFLILAVVVGLLLLYKYR